MLRCGGDRLLTPWGGRAPVSAAVGTVEPLVQGFRRAVVMFSFLSPICAVAEAALQEGFRAAKGDLWPQQRVQMRPGSQEFLW